MLVVKIHQLDTVVCIVYRPPDTRLEEFAGLLQCLDSTLSGLPTPSPTVIVMGDMNLPKSCILWRRSEDGLLVPIVAGHRDGKTAGGKQDRLQAQQLVDLASKHCLLQEVECPTHAVEILDLVFSNNCELLSSVAVENWDTFTDHRLVIAHTTYQYRQEDQEREQQYLCETGKRYSALNFYKAQWQEVKEQLSKVDWRKMEDLAKSCPTSALAEFHDQVLQVLEKSVPLKKKQARGHPKMHRMRRLLWRRLAKVRKRFKTASSMNNLTECLQEMWELEQQLSCDYQATSSMEEDEAVFKIKSNSKAFFSFARSRQKVKAKVGPFIDAASGGPNPSPDFAAEALCQ